MDAYEATKVVFSRIQALDPDHAAKIMGLLLIQDHGDKEMIRLAFGPESLLHAVMARARKDLGLLLPASSPTSGHSAPFLQLPRQNSGRGGGAPSPLSVSSPSSWAQAPAFSRSNSTSNNGAADEAVAAGEELPSPVNGGAAPFFPSSHGGGGDALLDDLQLQEQLAFLNEGGGGSGNPAAHQLPGLDGGECWSPGPGDGLPFGLGWPNGGGGPVHRRSASVSELCLGGGGGADGFGWKPCLYYARGFCKNGSSCRFVHGGLPDDAAAKMEAADQQQQQHCQDFLLRSKSQRLGFPYSPTGSLPGSPSAATKCLSFLLLQQQQQHDRAAAAAALMLGGGGADDAHKFMGRPRLDRTDFASMMNPGSRQIYLTFPADSTFREEDVSNYFSIYGPVHDVRIPYQQKRMFGFVTFVYPETVKLILAKGNPHFICDARVLVKPYKEKGKVPDKYRKQQQGDFSGCTTPTGLDARDPFDLHQIGARMLQHSNSANELLLRRKLEEQQQAAELQQAIELQNRRLIGLQLLDLKARSAATASPLPTPTANAFTSSQSMSSNVVESPPESGEQLKLSSAFAPEGKVNGGDKEESAGEASPNAAGSDQSGEHNLPDSPFASSNKPAVFAHDSFTATTETESGASRIVVDTGSNTDGGSNHLRPPMLDIPSPRPYFFPMHRLSSDHGAMGM
ncbi:unnamed protein product [Urochloa decumbens]|uniref:Uncharacterized protein n=1 Tax=Urochloa decumbens TaxID=240449 RepID=A0ABC8XQC4_9POAL